MAELHRRIREPRGRNSKSESGNDKSARQRRKKIGARYYIIGELIVKSFPGVLRFEPGTKTENAIEFEPFETFLSVLAADMGLVARLKDEAAHRLLLKNQDR